MYLRISSKRDDSFLSPARFSSTMTCDYIDISGAPTTQAIRSVSRLAACFTKHKEQHGSPEKEAGKYCGNFATGVCSPNNWIM